MYTVKRYHDISVGHTVHCHEGKCQHLHGHNYRVHFSLKSEDLDPLGRVVDFSVIKEVLCDWLERNWDHRFLVFAEDPRALALEAIDPTTVVVPFNPTAENMAEYLVLVIAPVLLADTPLKVTSVLIEETAKCWAEYTL